MRKYKKLFFRFTCLIAALTVFFLIQSCKNGKDEAMISENSDSETAASAEILSSDSSDWRDHYPAQYESFLSSSEMEESPTGYGGSIPVQKLDQNPEMRTLYSGIGFSKDYKEDRGHIYSWQDLVESGRIGEKTPTSCLVCKTPIVEQLFREEGWDFAKKPLSLHTDKEQHPVSCVHCHDPETKGLRVIQPAFIEAITASGVDLETATKKQMKNYVCAQCHSEYYFEPGSKKVIHPWDNGLTPEAMYDYYSSKPGGFEKDFVNKYSGADMLKAQHPDYEDFTSGIHADAGLTCATCHMSWNEDEYGVKYSSHQITSPLKTVDQSCMWCHKGKTEEWLIERVRYNQNAVASLQETTGKSLEKTHKIIGRAVESAGNDNNMITKARDTVREAQWYWDYVASANSMGAHNPVQALRSLAKASELSNLAREFCYKLKGEF